MLQEIAKILDSEADIEDVDLMINKNGKKHYIQLKSGPEGFTRPALRKTKETFKKLKSENPGAVIVIAFAYGEKSQLSPIWGKEVYLSADLVLIGKEFWDYFFGKDFYERLINIFSKARVKRNSKKKAYLKRKSYQQIFNTVYARILKERN